MKSINTKKQRPAMIARSLRSSLLVAGLVSAGLVAPAYAADLSIESWRTDDQAIWDEKILPAFKAAYPDINVSFSPSKPTEYDAGLNAKLEGGTAGDLITCRPFDRALKLYQQGHLADIKDMNGLDQFSDVAKAAWSTDDGDAIFCVPMAAVIHGFMYNKDAFKELGLEVPATVDDFYAVLDKIKEDGSYIPMAMGTKDQWEAATMGYSNIGPAYWGGEEGRLGLIDGSASFNDEGFLQAFKEMARWKDYLGDGYQAQTYTDSQNLFTLGRAAIYPTGSWEITGFQENSDFELGAFAPPKVSADGKCYISDHTDIGIGMNANAKESEAAMKFLEWATSAEFADLLTNASPGFFSLSKHEINVENPLAQEFFAMRAECDPTIRLTYQILSRGEPALSNHMWVLNANVINGTMTPEEAAADAQKNIDEFHKKP